MADSNHIDKLPDEVATRSKELIEAGLAESKAIGQAVADLERNADWEREEIADAIGIDPDTLYSYQSKAGDDSDEALRLFVMTYGATRTILAEATGLRYPNEHVFIVSEFTGAGDYETSREGGQRIGVIHAKGGASGGGPTVHIDITTERYDDLDHLADQKYRDAEFGDIRKASRWYTLLVDAGVDEATLAEPGKQLPASHPDSADHLQYQLQSIEREGDDRRPPQGRR